MKYVTNAPDAPAAIGPYSQAVVVNNMMFLSGQIPLDPKSGKIESNDIAEQATQVMKNLAAVLKSEGFTFQNVVQSRIYLTDLNNFQIVNEIYESHLGGVKPARATIQVAALPKGAEVEVEMVAIKE